MQGVELELAQRSFGGACAGLLHILGLRIGAKAFVRMPQGKQPELRYHRYTEYQHLFQRLCKNINCIWNGKGKFFDEEHPLIRNDFTILDRPWNNQRVDQLDALLTQALIAVREYKKMRDLVPNSRGTISVQQKHFRSKTKLRDVK